MPKVIDEDRVFEVAAALFVRHGYAGTKTKEIARKAGLNEATLFRRYGSKARSLPMGAAIDHQWRDVPLAGLAPSDDLEADLVMIVEAYLETNRLRGAIVPALLVELAMQHRLERCLRRCARQRRRARGNPPPSSGRGSCPGRGARDGVARTDRTAHGPRDVLCADLGQPLPAIDAPAYVRVFLEGRSIKV